MPQTADRRPQTKYQTPRKFFFGLLVSFISINSFAKEKTEEEKLEGNKTDKHFLYAGVSSTSASFDGVGSKSRNTSFNVGYHYKTDSGYVFGVYYNPSPISEKAASSDGSRSSLDSSVLGYYVGGSPFKRNKNLLLTGGFNITSATISGEDAYYRYQYGGAGFGTNVGLWYLADKFFVGGRVSTHRVSIDSLALSASGVALSLNSGFSF